MECEAQKCTLFLISAAEILGEEEIGTTGAEMGQMSPGRITELGGGAEASLLEETSFHGLSSPTPYVCSFLPDFQNC